MFSQENVFESKRLGVGRFLCDILICECLRLCSDKLCLMLCSGKDCRPLCSVKAPGRELFSVTLDCREMFSGKPLDCREVFSGRPLVCLSTSSASEIFLGDFNRLLNSCSHFAVSISVGGGGNGSSLLNTSVSKTTGGEGGGRSGLGTRGSWNKSG